MEESESEVGQEGEVVQIYVNQYTNKEIHININIGIVSPYQLGEANRMLRSATENDVVHLHINTLGGHLDATVEFVAAMKQCSAPIIGYLSAGSSAGSIIFLACDAWVLHDLSTMMIHIPTAGAIGNISDIVVQADQLKELARRLMYKYYAGFLTDEEIESLLDGASDKYLFYEDIQVRLENLKSLREEIHEKELAEFDEEIIDESATE